MSYAGHIIGGPADPDYHGAVLTADLAIGDVVLHVDDVADFDEDAAERDARIMLGVDSTAEGALDASTATSLAYVTCDDDASTVTLLVASTVAASSGDRIYVQDPVSGLPVVDYVVMVALDDGDTTGDALPVTLSSGLAATVGDLSDLSDQSVTFEEDDDGELIATDLPGASPSTGAVKAFQDSLAVVALGDQTLNLTYKPLPDTSVHLYWNGIFQPDDQWTRDGWTMTIPDGSGYIEVGDELMAKYLYTDPTARVCRIVSVRPGTVTLGGNDGLLTLPPHTGSAVVGGSAWADDTDATYALISSKDDPTAGWNGSEFAIAPLPTLNDLGIDPATVFGATLRLRTSAASSTGNIEAYVIDEPGETASAFINQPGPSVIAAVYPAPPTPAVFSGPFVLADLIAVMQTTPVLRVLGEDYVAGEVHDLKIYEAWIDLTVCTTG